jgi:cobalamin biosynthesis Co2+ chelatase CbiK
MEAPHPLLVALENENVALDLLHETMRPRYHALQRLHQMNGDEYNKMTKQFNKMNNRQKLLKRWITIHNNPRLLGWEGSEQIGHDVVDKYHDMVDVFLRTGKIKGATRLAFGNTV